ncbi:hypothetical protein [Bacillus swezeyi]|nr:hypothetical protein [Bacillus swezeyi]
MTAAENAENEGVYVTDKECIWTLYGYT